MRAEVIVFVCLRCRAIGFKTRIEDADPHTHGKGIRRPLGWTYPECSGTSIEAPDHIQAAFKCGGVDAAWEVWHGTTP